MHRFSQTRSFRYLSLAPKPSVLAASVPSSRPLFLRPANTLPPLILLNPARPYLHFLLPVVSAIPRSFSISIVEEHTLLHSHFFLICSQLPYAIPWDICPRQ